jgi:adenylosuccinate lyase
MTAAEQWFERTLDDSSNKRLSIPESFLAIDGCLLIVSNVARGLGRLSQNHRSRRDGRAALHGHRRNLMAAVRAGGDRQTLHEITRLIGRI